MIERGRKDRLSALRNVPKKKLLEETAKIDKVLSKFKTHRITKTKELFHAERKKPMWMRLQNKIKELGKNLSQLEASKDKDISNFRHWKRLERKYSTRVKRLNVAIEELRQRITAFEAKVRSFQGWVDNYRQNRLFENNQR